MIIERLWSLPNRFDTLTANGSDCQHCKTRDNHAGFFVGGQRQTSTANRWLHRFVHRFENQS